MIRIFGMFGEAVLHGERDGLNHTGSFGVLSDRFRALS